VRLRFVLVDVFADRPLAGNPLAVFPEADGIPEEKLQPIAREMDHPATAFLLRPTLPGAAFRVRVFSREREIAFAGHPALGAHFVHALEAGRPGFAGGRVSHEGAEGLFEVEFAPEEDGIARLRLRHRLPEFGPRLDDEDVAAVASALAVSEQDVQAANQPVRIVSTGLPVLIVPVVTLESLFRARPRPGALADLLEGREAALVYAFTKETRDARAAAHARAFDVDGSVEIPGAGAAAGALAAYLVAEAAVPVAPTTLLSIEQGHFLSRPSTLFAEVRTRDGEITDVIVGGRVMRVGEGYLALDV
jgi:trans-2,3-dihydro-3-hydroxyanthranilate isomerase